MLLFSSSETDCDAHIAISSVKKRNNISGKDPTKRQIPRRAASKKKEFQKYIAKSFRIALSEVKELDVYTDTDAESTLIMKGKYLEQSKPNAMCIFKALHKISAVSKTSKDTTMGNEICGMQA